MWQKYEHAITLLCYGVLAAMALHVVVVGALAGAKL